MTKTKFLIVFTPSLTGGGWNVFYRFIKYITAHKNIPIYVVGAGKGDGRLEKLKRQQLHRIILPYLDYNKYVHKLESNSILNILFNLPFICLSFLVGLVISLKNYKDEKIFLSNGLLSIMPAIGLKLFINNRLRLYPWIHTDTQFHKSKKLRKLVLFCLKYVDLFLANSEDVANDLHGCGVNMKKVVVVKNWVDKINISKTIDKFREKYKVLDKYRFRVIYVGRFVPYKHFPLYLNVAKKLASEEMAFIFVGDGELYNIAKEVASKNKNIFVLRGIPDEELRYLYSITNVTLTYADETYLSLTALESLSMGTPIIYVDISVSPAKYHKKVKIKRELVPKDIGFKVEASVEEMSELIESLKNVSFPSDDIRAKCREYIDLNHSEKNAKMLANIIVGGENGKNR